MSIKDVVVVVCAVITSAATVGGVLIYLGRMLGKLETISQGVEVALTKTDRLDSAVARIDKELTEVKTKQCDCAHCP